MVKVQNEKQKTMDQDEAFKW